MRLVDSMVRHPSGNDIKSASNLSNEVAQHESCPRKSEQDDKWSLRLAAGTPCLANQERQLAEDRAETTHRQILSCTGEQRAQGQALGASRDGPTAFQGRSCGSRIPK